MSTFIRSMLVAGLLTLSVSGPAAAQSAGIAQRYKAKHGRPLPGAEAPVRTQTASSATPAADAWRKQYLRAKFGRATPAGQGRAKADRESAAAPARWLVLLKAKHGRASAM